MRHRKLPESNYSAIFINGKTLRIPLDAKKPITELAWPEFYDISPGNKCSGGCDEYCYAAALKTGTHYKDLAKKVNSFFGSMPDNNKPFQVAIGGEQEPLENPEIWEMIQEFKRLGIVPNYTTNGMFINDKNIELTIKHCGGVAVTLHTHLEKFWRRALNRLTEAKVRTNVHIIISDKASVDFLEKLYDEYVTNGTVEYFVLLPYMNYGHAKSHPKKIDFVALEKFIDKVYKDGRLAFGANFYNFLLKHKKKYNVSLYSPEIVSKYLILDDKMGVYNNSFDKVPVNYDPITGCEVGKVRTHFIEVE